MRAAGSTLPSPEQCVDVGRGVGWGVWFEGTIGEQWDIVKGDTPEMGNACAHGRARKRTVAGK